MNNRKDDWKPGTQKQDLKARAELLTNIRAFFAARDVLEVETPVLSAAGNSDPGLQPLHLDAPDKWLRTSPEYALKRLLAAGIGDVYELARVFRGGENGRHHNIEFTLLEWYRVGWHYHQLMDEVEQLVQACVPATTLARQNFSYRELFSHYAGFDPLTVEDDELPRIATGHGIDAPAMERNAWLDLLLSAVVQPALPANTLTFVCDYPADQAALARIRNDQPPVAERFELYFGSLELANGYQELTDAAEQRQRFETENRRRALPVPLDEHLLAALESGLPECAGVALGVDRLLLAISGRQHLNEVIAFTSDHA